MTTIYNAIMNILILGGTKFLGRHLVDAALLRGHKLTLFNRGSTLATAPETVKADAIWGAVEHIHGNRDGDLSLLAGRTWDAVIDTCGYVPRIVRQSARALANAAGHYTFISTISVYADVSQPGVDENAPLKTLSDPNTETIDGDTYGGLKVLCEDELLSTLPNRALIIRPGLIVGPFDPSDRFTYWVRRMGRGGEALAPGHPERVVQLIDVRDLAEWTIRMVETGQTGILNATGPAQPLPFGDVLDACQRVGNSGATIRWVDETFITQQNVQAWSELPLWLPQSDPSLAGFMYIDCSHALTMGLSFRSLDNTVQATYAWDCTRPANVPMKAGLTRAREMQLLAQI